MKQLSSPLDFTAALVLAATLNGCGRTRINEDAVVDCSTLTPIPMALAEDLDSLTLLDDLRPGEAQVTMLWTTKHGTRAYISPPARGVALTNLFGGWAVQAKLSCIPPSTTSIHLEAPSDGPRPLSEGTYPLSALGFDVPYLEQGDEPDSTERDGDIVVLAVSERTVTGYLDGQASTDLKSNFGQRPLNITVEVVAFAFNEVRLLDDYTSIK